MKNPAICTGICPPSNQHSYCARCTIALRHSIAPGKRMSDIEADLDILSRRRALTEQESVLLEYAILLNGRRVAWNEKRRERAA